MAIIVEQLQAAEKLNTVLHEYGEHIIGRMGLPYREKGVHIVSVALDAPQDTIAAAEANVKSIFENVFIYGLCCFLRMLS